MIVDILICLLGGLCAALMGFLLGRKHDSTRGQKPGTEPAETPRPLAASETLARLQEALASTRDSGGGDAERDDAIRAWLKQ